MTSLHARRGNNGPISGRFIVGMSRAGTTWMVRSLNLHPLVAGFGESNFWARLFVHPSRSGRYDARQLRRVRNAMRSNPLDSTIGRVETGWLKRIRRADIPDLVDRSLWALDEPVRPGAVYLRLAEAIAHAEGKSFWIDKTPQHLNHMERIEAELPGSRFIVMLREPYGFMLSYKHQMDRGNPERRERFRRLYHPIACAWVWRKYMQSALRAQRKFPSQVMIVDHKDIRTRPREILQRAQQFLGIEPLVEIEGMAGEVNTSFEDRERPNLLEHEIFWMNLIAGSQIAASPFDLRTALPRPMDVLRPLLTLPLWAGRLIADAWNGPRNATLSYLWTWISPR